jgi:LPS-assembly protein
MVVLLSCARRMKQLPCVILLCCLCWTAFSLRAAEKEAAWQIRAQDDQGEVEFDPATGMITAPQGVVVHYRDIVLSARQVIANERTGEVFAEGDVTIVTAGHVWMGENVFYNFRTREMEAGKFRTGHDPAYVEGSGLSGSQVENVYTATNAVITTDNYENPAFKIRARRLTFTPGQSVEAWGAILLLGDVPVFYFPYYKRNIGKRSNNLNFTPGYRSSHGPFLLTTYRWFWGDHLDGALHFDWRERRGIGTGADVHFDAGRGGDGFARYYYADDQRPGRDSQGRAINRERQRLGFSYAATIRTNLGAKAVVAYQTDPFIIRDFFESEYRRNVQPKTFVELEQLWPNYSLNLYVQPRLNDFFETVERLPDLRLTGLRQQIGGTPLYYESESTVGYYQRKFADDHLPYFAAGRADTYHQVVLPHTFFGWLTVTPRVGGRYTYYSEADGPGAMTDEQHRAVFNTGAEVSTKASQLWAGVRSRFWDLDGVRHIIQPSVNYVFVPAPNRRPPSLPQFDYEVPSLRLLPIEFPEYNAIDAIDTQNVLRFTLLNRLQTKRALGIENVVNWALYMDWRLNPRRDQTTFSDFYSDLSVRPRSWMTLQSMTRFGIEEGVLRESLHRLIVRPNNVWSVSLGHRYLRPEPSFGREDGNNLISSSIYYRLNENWGVRASHFLEARDGTIEEQFYTVYRDLRSLTSALTFRVRESRTGSDDFTVAVTFSLKAFPRYGMGSDADHPALLVGR